MNRKFLRSFKISDDGLELDDDFGSDIDDIAWAVSCVVI